MSASPKSVFFIWLSFCSCLPNSAPKVKPKTWGSFFSPPGILHTQTIPPHSVFHLLHRSQSVSFLPCFLLLCSLQHHHLLSGFLPQPRNWFPCPLSTPHRVIKVIFQSHLSIQGDQSNRLEMFEMQKPLKMIMSFFLYRTSLAFHCSDSVIPPL